MKRPLNQISIKGFKSIRELENLELRPLNVLIGANGSGKTNFVSAFEFLRQIVDENLQIHVGQAGGADALLYFGSRTTSKIVFNLSFGLPSGRHRNGYNCTLMPTSGDSLIFAEEEYWYQDTERYDSPYEVHLGEGHKETRLFEESKKSPVMTIADHVIRAMRSWRVYHFHDTSKESKIKKTGDLNDNAVLRPDASNLAAFLYLLQEKHPDHYQQIVATIQLVAPFFDGFVLRPNPLNPEKIQLEWREKGSDAYFSAYSLSDGTLRFMCLATLLLQPELPAIILIDEPELGLHPYAITLLASMFRSTATKAQIIVSTQSVSLVNQFGPEEIIVVDRRDRQSTFERLEPKDLEAWMDDYGMGDLWEKNLLGGRPK